MVPPHPTISSVHVKSLELVNVNLFGKGVFADVVKDLEMRSFWISQVGPKSDEKCP